MQPFCLIDFSAYLLTTLIFGAIGYSVARGAKSAPSFAAALLIVLGTMFVGYFIVNIQLLSLFGFTIYLHHALQGFGFGLILGFMTRQPKKPQTDQTTPA
jgi:hypothetical protein